MRRAASVTHDPHIPGGAARCCESFGCTQPGEYRAPRSRAKLDEYFWFCLDHVRAYNAAWNYYAGMNEREIEAAIRSDTVWHRPSWPLGSRTGPLHAGRLRDSFGLFGEGEGERRHGAGERPQRRPLSAEEEALAIFDIEAPFTLTRLKARYKELVKLNHPDAHGGDKAAEERLKIINQAYTTLKASYFS